MQCVCETYPKVGRMGSDDVRRLFTVCFQSNHQQQQQQQGAAAAAAAAEAAAAEAAAAGCWMTPALCHDE